MPQVDTPKLTLRKPDKIRFKSEFDYIRADGTKRVGAKMLVVHAPAQDGKLRCAVICGKKYSKLAVKRNRARRLLWESFRMLKDRIKPCHMLLITRKNIGQSNRQDVTKEMAYLLANAGMLIRDEAIQPPGC